MTIGNRNPYLREHETDFTCNTCSGTIMYVQVLEPGAKVVADFFQCERCGLRIESREMKEEEFPAFYD